MAEVINMPRLSDTMEEGTVAKWLKQKGDKVKEGDILAEIETDKATMEFESFYEGTLLHIGVQEGEVAPVDSLLAIIGKEGEDISALIKGEKTTQEETPIQATNTIKEQENTMPEGVEVITMPRLSDTMEEGTVAKWLKQKGDKIKEGDILAEIETDKATMEFESFYEGTLLYIGVQEGEVAPVDSLLAIVGPEGTDVNNIINKTPSDKTVVVKEEANQHKEEINKNTSKEIKTERIFISPLARKIAEDKGIDINSIKGTGENGRIVKRDVETYKAEINSANITKSTSTTNEVNEKPNIYATESFEEVNNSQMRKTIAKRLAESKFTAPHYYLTIELDMDNTINARKQINELPGVKVSFNDMIIKASAMALRKHPQVNSQWANATTKIAKHIHIGVAVAVEDGLVVPVLPFADQMSMHEIGNNVKELANKARNKKLQPKEMEGSTFTVSNLGMFGIEEFTSIINQPNSAILSVGAIIEKPVVKNGNIVVGHTMKITLACDHRTVDGATGAQFLQTLKQYIENPVTMLV